MTELPDRLYELLPYVYRLRDGEKSEPLRRFLQVIEQQVSVLERDLARSYDNWFIETCEDWVVPYIAELLGHRPVTPAGNPGQAQRTEGMLMRRTLAPRTEVAAAMAHARRKGTLPLLEEIARVVAGWPARAVEGARRISYTQPVRALRLDRGRALSVREAAALEALSGPFDGCAHTVDVRRPSADPPGLSNLASVAVFCCRLRALPVTYCKPYLQEGAGAGGRGSYWFNVLGQETQLFSRPAPEADAFHLAGPENLPLPISRNALERDLRGDKRLYGEQASLCIWLDRGHGLQPVSASQIVSADLSKWKQQPQAELVLVDPELGRFRVAGKLLSARVSYHTACAAALGGGEYDRDLATPVEPHRCYRVDGVQYDTLAAALEAWARDMEQRRAGDPTIEPRAIIEICLREALFGCPRIELGEGETLVVRAADRNRAVLWLADEQPDASDAMTVTGTASSRFVLDGVTVAQRGLELRGPFEQVVLRHATIVPLRASHAGDVGAAQLVLADVVGDVLIDRCIVGALSVTTAGEPTRLELRDSVIDAGADDAFALSDDGEGTIAHASLRIRNCTLFGSTAVHAIELAENSIFSGPVQVARRQPGCVRFCYLPDGSRTPRRFQCQPDLAASVDEDAAFLRVERDRLRPIWTSRRYGEPGYAQLHARVAPEIARGADDESELGALHDLFAPQRTDALLQRLKEYVPAATDAGIFFVT